MPGYVMLGRWTEQGIQTVKQSPKRLNAGKQLIKEAGGEMRSFYLTMGQYDFVAVVEAPDDASLAKVLLAIGSHGNVQTETLKAFNEAEYKELIASAP